MEEDVSPDTQGHTQTLSLIAPRRRFLASCLKQGRWLFITESTIYKQD